MFLEKELRIGLSVLGIASFAAINESNLTNAQAQNLLYHYRVECYFVDDQLPKPVLSIDDMYVPTQDISGLTVRDIDKDAFWANMTIPAPFSPRIQLFPLVLEEEDSYQINLKYRQNGVFVVDQQVFTAPDCKGISA